MFKPLSLYIGLRYTRAKRRNGFISFISMMSMVGIALGVAVLITVLSVMNGFDQQIREQIFSMTPQVTISTFSNKLENVDQLEQDLTKIEKQNNLPHILGMAPYVAGQGMLSANGVVQPMMITGVDPSQESKVSELQQKIQGHYSLSELKKGGFGIVVGETLAARMGLEVGSYVNVIVPQASFTPVGIIPTFKRFKVAAIFHAGSGFNFDNIMSFINIHDAQALFKLGDDVSGLRLKIDNGLLAPQFSVQLMEKLPRQYDVRNWSDQYGPLFHAIALEKNMMFLILLLIIMVAVFNLVSSLVMVVNEKQADIAILRTLGARSKTIMSVFVVQGAVVGIIGTVLGVIGGIVLSLNVTAVVNWIQHTFGVQLISSAVYLVNYLPSKIEPADVVHITLFALLFSLLATIYPAWRASKTQPVEALRYE